MIWKSTIEGWRERPGIGWITGLKSASIRPLVEEGQVQRDLFDERNLLEIVSPAYPGERRMVCRNPSLAGVRAKKRKALLAATEDKLRGIQAGVGAGRHKGAEAIGLAVGKVINHTKVDKPLPPWRASASARRAGSTKACASLRTKRLTRGAMDYIRPLQTRKGQKT
jgi:hypothetical protein